MKRVFLLLIMLTLGMVSINVSAQTKTPVRKTTAQTKPNPIPKDSRDYQVGDDGFEWYKVCKNGKYGAESRDGKLIIPTEYKSVYYHAETSNSAHRYPAHFKVSLGESEGAYSVLGKCIIPITRHYTEIDMLADKEFGTYYMFRSSDGAGVCNAKGQQLAHFKDVLWVFPKIRNDIFYYELQDKGGYWGIGDNTGKVIVKPQPGLIFLIKGKFVSDSVQLADVASLNSTVNPFANNHEEENNLLPSNSSSSDNNSNNRTTTVVVEHHRDPVPMQEWQQCVACFGSGQCPNASCGGSGWYYIGNKARTCPRCHGSGKCTICAGKGGQYVTVYR